MFNSGLPTETAHGHDAPVSVRSTTLSAVITRANGDVENLGVIAFHHVNPLRVLVWKIGHIFGQNKVGIDP
jgi:hypothetical protein